MRNFIPRMIEASEPARMLRAKFGGLPFGLARERWPICRECGEPMSSLAQIPVRGHLDLAPPFEGRPELADRVLHVFVCERPSICSFWEPDGPANSAFFVPTRELDGAASPDHPATPLLPEVWIGGWSPRQDVVAAETAAAYCDHARFYELPDEAQFPHDFDHDLMTKLGGVPYWTGNGPVQALSQPFRYVMQIDKFLPVPGAEDGLVDLANFCSDGTGYLFTDPESPELATKFLINR